MNDLCSTRIYEKNPLPNPRGEDRGDSVKFHKVEVYILASKYNGTLYIGMTSDLVKRVWEHKNKFVSGFTAQYNVTKLVYYEIFNDIQLG